MNDITVNDILNDREVGTIIPLLVMVGGEDVPMFFVKDYKKTIEVIEENDIIALKNSIIGTDDCLLFLLIFKFANSFETTYDVWFNYGEEWHNDFLNILKGSKRMVIDFRDENNERVKTVEIENTVKEIVEDYITKCSENILYKSGKNNNIIKLEKVEKYKTWNIDDVNNMLDNMFDSYDSIEDLWDNV